MLNREHIQEGKSTCSTSPMQLCQPEQRTNWFVGLSIPVILLIHVLLLLDASRKNFVVIDEAGHFVAGISHWTTGTYSMYRVNPPLPRMLAVIPIFLLDTNIKSIQPILGTSLKRAEFDCANLFALDNAEHYLDILFVARLAGMLWSCLGGWLLYRWGSELYSSGAGLLALVLWCFNPSILAHAQVGTPDLPATVAGLAATYCFWRYLRSPSWSKALLAGLVLGIAELTKFTLLILYALWPLLWLLSRCRLHSPGTHSSSFGGQFRQCLAIVIVSLFVINLGYEFQDTGKPLGEYVFGTRLLGGEPSPGMSNLHAGVNRFKGSWLGVLPVPLPAEFLAGIDRQRLDFEIGWWSYLRGE